MGRHRQVAEAPGPVLDATPEGWAALWVRASRDDVARRLGRIRLPAYVGPCSEEWAAALPHPALDGPGGVHRQGVRLSVRMKAPVLAADVADGVLRVSVLSRGGLVTQWSPGAPASPEGAGPRVGCDAALAIRTLVPDEEELRPEPDLLSRVEAALAAAPDGTPHPLAGLLACFAMPDWPIEAAFADLLGHPQPGIDLVLGPPRLRGRR